MQKDILLIDIPKFQVDYSEEEYGYTSKKGRENLAEALYSASRGYCMYCYSRIKIDNKRNGQLEHAIEKNISPEKLTDCVPNIGLSCSTCNGSYKRRHERTRKPSRSAIEKFEKTGECKKRCFAECTAYLELKRKYLSHEEAHIILQPCGVRGEDTGQDFSLQYDVLETKFIPNSEKSYAARETKFIEDHINTFHLNAKEDKTKQLLYFIEDIINHNGNYSQIQYNNMIVELFIEQILKGKSTNEILKICKLIYSISVVKFNT